MLLPTPTQMMESPWALRVASVLLVVLLAAFYAVVSNAAQAGELRRQTYATQAVAAVRCHALSAGEAGRNCLSRRVAPNRSGNPQATEETVLVAAR